MNKFKPAELNRQRSLSLSDLSIQEIKEVTNGTISISGFVRLAIRNELKRWRSTNERE